MGGLDQAAGDNDEVQVFTDFAQRCTAKRTCTQGYCWRYGS